MPMKTYLLNGGNKATAKRSRTIFSSLCLKCRKKQSKPWHRRCRNDVHDKFRLLQEKKRYRKHRREIGLNLQDTMADISYYPMRSKHAFCRRRRTFSRRMHPNEWFRCGTQSPLHDIISVCVHSASAPYRAVILLVNTNWSQIDLFQFF